ncbi:hypothetical protein [Aquimarina sp. 2201CG14-23]|uniref:hypothetical protein n=1 Tax=Aquimarina mycalae TaxID=3040073 RepID=UPI002478035D|nr:hypothetical protein [Aquimarina sp. 2201CG14-23]MDH7445982.1 hypothetical protein [Aquimarina sp. 2201CG14-23]
MNRKLYNDWHQGIGLFKNSILCCEKEYPQDIQLDILQIIWKYLKSNLELDETLFFLNDWHNHDGHISKEKLIDKKKFQSILTDPKEVLKNRDFYVYDLVYSESEKFMLRWYCQNEGENEIYCDFTLILSNFKELQKVEKLIRENIIDDGLKIEDTKQYFDKRYGG